MFLFRRPPAINFLAEKRRISAIRKFRKTWKASNSEQATEQKKHDAISEEQRLLGEKKVMDLSLFSESVEEVVAARLIS